MTCDRIERRRISRPGRGLGRLIAIAALAALPAPLAAQYGQPSAPPQDVPRPGSSDSEAPAVASQEDVLRGAACQVARNAASVEPLLATAPHSSGERTQAVRILGLVQRCLRLRDPIATNAAVLRGSVAEALYESRFATAQAAHSPVLAVQPLFRPDQASNRDTAASLAPAYALAECTAAGHGELVRGLLATEPGSPEAQAAFNALNPAFSACVSGNTQIAVDGRTLRGMLAENLYRWSVVQRDGPTSPLAGTAAATP